MLEWPESGASQRDISNLPQAVIKISNITWDLRKNDVRDYLSAICLVELHWIHIPIDIDSGKTKAEIYVEIPTSIQAYNCQEYLSNKILKGRLVIITVSSFEELLMAILPRDAMQSFLTENDVLKIVNICTNYKTHFSRKCPERPVEYAESIVRLIPWYKLSKDSLVAVLKMIKQLKLSA